VPNVPLDAWQELVYPLLPEELADLMDVVVLAQARTPEEAARMAQRLRAAQVRPRVVVAWVRWLHEVYSRRPWQLNFQFRPGALAYWQGMNEVSVPVAVQQNVHFVQTDDDSGDSPPDVAGVAAGIRAGYAGARPDVEDVMPPQDMPDVQLDCDLEAPLATEQLQHETVSQILRVQPCRLQLPERQCVAAPDLLLPAETAVVHDLGVLLELVGQVSAVDAAGLYEQVDHHVKAVVRQHQLAVDNDH
jgi:hypothetical protein